MDVLVVDDMQTIRILVSIVIERDIPNSRVSEAADGIEALEIIAKNEPDFMFLDTQMPNLDGYGVLERLRQQGSGLYEKGAYCIFTANRPHVVITELQRRGLYQGDITVLQKPIGQEQIVECIKAYEKRTRMQDYAGD